MNGITDTVLLMLEGTETTLEIFVITLVAALPLGLLASLGRISKLKPLSRLIEFYIWLMRGTPLMLQLLFVYFALPMAGIMLPDIGAALLAFILNYAAYFAEIFRAGIQGVSRGQYEAARTLGMTYGQTMRHIILPQAVKNSLPAIFNEFIALLKESAIVGYIGLVDLTKAGDIIRSNTYEAFMPLIAVALVYLVIVMFMTSMVGRLERRLKKDAR